MSAMAKLRNRGGFSLVELLVVMAILGLVMMSIYSLYQSTQRSTTTQDEVVELQQNLRVAMDRIVRDIRMAGFMIPSGTPISIASANAFTMQTASAAGRIVRIDEDFSSPVNDTTAEKTFKVASGDMVDLFENDDVVRIIRPPDHAQPLADTFLVSGKSRTVPNLQLKDFNTAQTIYFKAGDVIVRTTAAAPHPNTVAYALSGGVIQRAANGDTPEDVASGITALNFRYLLDDGSRPSAPTTGELSSIKAVEVTITGQVTTQEGTKSRSITNVVTLRNR